MNKKVTFALFMAAIAATTVASAQLKVGSPAGTPNSMLQVVGPVSTDYRTVTTNTTLDNTYSVVVANQASGAIILTLPLASTCTGRQYSIQNKAANSTTISGGGGVDGGSMVLSAAGQTAVVVSDGTTWNLLSNTTKSTTAPIPVDLRLLGSGNHITSDAGVGGNGTSVGTGSNNIAFGTGSLNAVTTAGNLVAIGSQALNKNTTGIQNTAIGTQALFNNSNGDNNTALGYGALSGVTTAASTNTAVGMNAAVNLTAGSNNTTIGANTNLASATGSNQLNIANNIFGTGLTGSVGTPAGNIGIGVAAPTATLDVNGTARIRTVAAASAAGSVTPVGVDASGNIVKGYFAYGVTGTFDVSGSVVSTTQTASFNTTMGTPSNTTIPIVFTTAAATTNYMVDISLVGNGSDLNVPYITNKTANGFTMNFKETTGTVQSISVEYMVIMR